MTDQSAPVEQALKPCKYCGGAKRFQIVSPVSDHAWADCFCVKQSPSEAGLVELIAKAMFEDAYPPNADGIRDFGEWVDQQVSIEGQQPLADVYRKAARAAHSTLNAREQALVERIASFVRNWNGNTRDGNTFLIAEAIERRDYLATLNPKES